MGLFIDASLFSELFEECLDEFEFACDVVFVGRKLKQYNYRKYSKDFFIQSDVFYRDYQSLVAQKTDGSILKIFYK